MRQVCAVQASGPCCHRLGLDARAHTLCKRIDGELPLGVLREIFQSDFGLALPYHKMHDDQTLEYYGPSRVAQPVREGTEDLSDSCFACMGRDEDVFDILGLWGCKLWQRVSVSQWAEQGGEPPSAQGAAQYLDLRPALHALLKRACHGARGCCSRRCRGCAAEVAVCWVAAVVVVAAVAPLGLSQHAGSTQKNTGVVSINGRGGRRRAAAAVSTDTWLV